MITSAAGNYCSGAASYASSNFFPHSTIVGSSFGIALTLAAISGCASSACRTPFIINSSLLLPLIGVSHGPPICAQVSVFIRKVYHKGIVAGVRITYYYYPRPYLYVTLRKASLSAIIGSTIANLVLLFALRPVVIDSAMPLASLAVLPVASLTIMGAAGAIIVYALLRRYAPHPATTFLWVSALVLVLSLIPDYLVIDRMTGHFAGATPAAGLTLMLMHVVAAAIIVWSLISLWKKGGV